MLGLGNWVDKWKILGCKLPKFHSFSFYVMTFIFHHFLSSSCKLSHLQLISSIPFYWNSIQRIGIEQCFVLLGFLSLLENFGLVTPIPVGIRVVGVETPLLPRLFKRDRPQDKTDSFFNFFSFIYFSSFILIT